MKKSGILVLVFMLIFVYFGVNGKDDSTPTRESISFAVAGDWGGQESASRALKSVHKKKVDFALALGDLSYEDMTESAWCKFVKKNIGHQIPFLVVAGNHEDENLDDGIGGNIDKFTECLPPHDIHIFGTYGKQYYFDFKNLARFIVLPKDASLGGEVYQYNFGRERLRMIGDIIDEARGKDIRWIIVGVTNVCLSAGTQRCSSPDLINFLISKHVDLVIQADDHTYQRSKQLAIGGECYFINSGVYNSRCIADDGADSHYLRGKVLYF